MEPHKDLHLIESERPSVDDGPVEYFRKAKSFVEANYAAEMAAIWSVKFQEVTPDLFFREYMWVVHATGFSAKAVGRFMPRLVEAYGPWDSLAKAEFEAAFERVRTVCNNRQKASAVHRTAGLIYAEIADLGWEGFKEERLSSPPKLNGLPYVGPVTCFHLARNVGLLEHVKPDLHLIRLAEHWGFKDCVAMCEAVRPEGMPLGIVDLCLWYAASHWGTLDLRRPGAR